MALVNYTKMSGAGNTFIVVDGRELPPHIDLTALARAISSDHLEHGGADGFMAIVPWEGGDFEMKYFNRDGSSGMMCGNGGRCAVRFAADAGYVSDPEQISFTNAGVTYRASLTPRGVRVEFPDPRGFRLAFRLDLLGGARQCHFGDVGTPHAVLFVDEIGDPSIGSLAGLPIDRWGPALRHHPAFAPDGANANFVSVLPGGGIHLRTFERGVEAETGACGTGAITSAMIAAMQRGLTPPIAVAVTSDATLWVDFRLENGEPRDVSLEGNAETVMTGSVDLDELLEDPVAAA